MANRINKGHPYREARRYSASLLQAQQFTPTQQTKRLDERLGKSVGAVKERASLAVRMEKGS